MTQSSQRAPADQPQTDIAEAQSSLIDEVADWLMAQALGELDFEAMYAGCCDRMLAAGIALSRGHIAFTVLHPLYSSMGMTWRRQGGLELESYEHTEDRFNERFRASPLYHMVEHRVPFLRRRLTGDDALLDFPVMTELRDQGATDYLGFLVPFAVEGFDGMVGSWTTDRPSGFSDRDIRALLRLQQTLALACKIRIRDQIARNVVTAYLGADAGLRVLSGQIRRGDGQTIRAVIWYSDLRDSTRLAETLSRDDNIALLNAYFECAGGAVLAQGGEVLSFIGDAVLAIFPIGEGSSAVTQACENALAASRDAQRRLADVNAARETVGSEPLSFGLGLHLGEVVFGNIGLPERVSFSVIGPTVNEVARLEALTKTLGHPVLATESFARHLPEDWVGLGRHQLRGVGASIEVFAPPGTAA